MKGKGGRSADSGEGWLEHSTRCPRSAGIKARLDCAWLPQSMKTTGRGPSATWRITASVNSSQPLPDPGGSLVQWARNGVLLLNTCLTVEEGQAASHSGRGWERLTDAVIRHVAEGARPVVFMLWGNHAQTKRALIPADRGHLVLTSNHPSPLSALRPPAPFIGNGHFGQARAFRERQGA